MHPTVFRDSETNQCKSGVDYYFLEQNGERFKVCVPYQPYFLLRVKDKTEAECEQFLRRKFEGKLVSCARILKEDLDLKNHLVGLKQTYLKLSFHNVQDLMTVRTQVQPIVNKNKAKNKSTAYDASAFMEDEDDAQGNMSSSQRASAKASNRGDVKDFLLDIREYDVPYHMRVSIDNKLNVAKWYNVFCTGNADAPVLTERPDLLDRPDPIVLAYVRIPPVLGCSAKPSCVRAVEVLGSN